MLTVTSKTFSTTAPTVTKIDALQALYREGVRLAEEEQKILNEDPSGVIQHLTVLRALRNANESNPPPRKEKRGAAPSRGGRGISDMDGAADSPAPSQIF